MAYTVGSKQVIKDDRTTQLDTLTVQGGNYLEISEVALAQPNQMGDNYAFTAGGRGSPPSNPYVTAIDKWPYTQTSGTATDVGDLTEAKQRTSGHTDGSNGYTSGGYIQPPTSTGSTAIEKFPFAISSGTATSFGTIFTPPATGQHHTGAGSHSSFTDGFLAGGYDTTAGNARLSQISKFPFSSPVSSVTDTGDLLAIGLALASASTASEGFNAGFYAPDPASAPYQPAGPGYPGWGTRLIQKFPFAISGGTATDVGSLTVPRLDATGHTSSDYGFIAGGTGPNPPHAYGTYNTTIEKYPFAISSGNSTDVGDVNSPYTDARA